MTRYKATYDTQYLIRQPIGDSRINRYDKEKKQVRIWYKGQFDAETIFELQFIARRIQHILLKYYIRGRWCEERRKVYLGSITGEERRKAA